MLEEESEFFAVLGDEADAGGDRVARRIDGDRRAVDEERAALPSRMRAERGHHQFTASRADQPRDADHFSAPHAEADVVDEQLARHVRILDRHVARFEDDVGRNAMRRREDVGHFAPHHARDQALRVERAGVVDAHRFAVAQDRDAVRESEDFIELVRDVDHARSRLAQAFEDAVEHVDFAFRQRGGRLVEHEDAPLA